jgi:hypothetical protein
MRDWEYARKVAALVSAVRERVGEQVRRGATLEQAQERVDLSDFKKRFAAESFERGAAFDDFFARSAIERASGLSVTGDAATQERLNPLDETERGIRKSLEGPYPTTRCRSSCNCGSPVERLQQPFPSAELRMVDQYAWWIKRSTPRDCR